MDDATRRTVLRGLGTAGSTALVGGVAGCLTATRSADGDASVVEGFEDGLDGWTTAGHVGEDASSSFDWSIERTDARSRTGDWSLSVFTAGNHDDGTAWATTTLPVEPGTRYRARGSAYFYSEGESFNVVRHAVLYLGPREPTAEEDFPAPGENSSTGATGVGGLREPLDRAAGWNEYAFEWETETQSDRLYFAVGVSVVWETDRTDFVDDVTVAVERA